MTLSLTGITLLLLGIVGALLVAGMRAQFVRHFDDALLARAQMLHALLHRNARGNVEFDFSDEAMPEFNHSRSAEYFELWAAGGQSVERSNSLQGADLALASPPANAISYSDLRLPDGRPGRAVFLHITPANEDDDDRTPRTSEGTYLLAVARERAALDRTLATTRWAVLAAVLLLSVAIGSLTPWLIGRHLRPLQAIAERARDIDARALDRRFPIDHIPAELLPICQRLNDSLEHLQSAFDRERRFSADVAHELRTPIAELRLLTEVALKFPQDAASARSSFQDAHQIARRMELIVDTLLEMVDADSAPAAPAAAQSLEDIDLSSLVDKVWATLAPRAKARGITLASEGLDHIRSCAPLLERILSNLLDNAVEYAVPNSPVTCTLQRSLHLRITNHTRQLDPADLPHLAEPFWRKDPSRTGNRHAGLGLSLVRHYARKLGIVAHWDLLQPGLFAASLDFPESSTGSPGSPATKIESHDPAQPSSSAHATSVG